MQLSIEDSGTENTCTSFPFASFFCHLFQWPLNFTWSLFENIRGDQHGFYGKEQDNLNASLHGSANPLSRPTSRNLSRGQRTWGEAENEPGGWMLTNIEEIRICAVNFHNHFQKKTYGKRRNRKRPCRLRKIKAHLSTEPGIFSQLRADMRLSLKVRFCWVGGAKGFRELAQPPRGCMFWGEKGRDSILGTVSAKT